MGKVSALLFVDGKPSTLDKSWAVLRQRVCGTLISVLTVGREMF